MKDKSTTMWFNKNILKKEQEQVSNQEFETSQELEKRHPLETDKPILKLDDQTALVYTRWGGYVTVPTSNIDVATGVIRDRIIEPWTTQLVYQTLNVGDVYVNLGSNFGYYAVLGAHKVGRTGKVFAVEANPYMFLYLMKSIYWSGYPDVIRSFNFAVFSQSNIDISFFFDPQFAGGGSIRQPANEIETLSLESCFWNTSNLDSLLDENREWIKGKGLYTSIKAKTKKLDEMIDLFGKVALLSMDIEGAEVEAILGGKNFINSNPQMSIIMEWDPQANNHTSESYNRAKEMWSFLIDEMKYRVFRVKPETYKSIGSYPDLDALNDLTVWNIPHSDLFLIH